MWLRIRPAIRAFRDEVLKHQKAGKPLVDVRSTGEFTGEMLHMPDYPQEGALRAGHIPGAASVPWARAANEDGTFKVAKELEKIYCDEAGLKRRSPVIAYCRIGERSSHTWFVLHYLLGFPQGEELRRIVDRMGQHRRRADRARRRPAEPAGRAARDGGDFVVSDTPQERLAAIEAEFADLDPRERLELLLEFAEKLAPLPPHYQAERDAGLHRVHECQTPVFLWTTVEDGRVRIDADVAPERRRSKAS